MIHQEFTDLLNKLINVRIQEMKDGCNECKNGGCCTEHETIVLDMITDPKKYFRYVKGKIMELPLRSAAVKGGDV